jgi:hypothetical protein
MEMHAIQSKQASMSSGCIVRNPYLIALRQSCPLLDHDRLWPCKADCQRYNSGDSARRENPCREAYMEKLFGVIAEFDHAMILHKDTHYFGYVRAELINLTVKHRQLIHLEIAIGGYNDDSRALYEVPEVRRWVKLVHKAWPDSLLWLTPASLWIWVLCLNPGMCSRLPDGRMQIAMDTDVIVRQFAESLVAGEDVLSKGRMTEDQLERVRDQAQRNLMHMLERKKPGEDYTFVHPDTGKVVYYKREN